MVLRWNLTETNMEQEESEHLEDAKSMEHEGNPFQEEDGEINGNLIEF